MDRGQHNVMLGNAPSAPEPQDQLFGKSLPCPVCAAGMILKASYKQKPYCLCLECGIQIFFRGKLGIERLRRLVESQETAALEFPTANHAAGLYNRLQQLKQEKEAYEQKQGVIFRDSDLDNVIATIDAQIKQVQLALEKAKKEAEKRK
jgi:hypothetical protein